MISPSNAAAQMATAMRAAGLNPPDTLIADGKLRRFQANGKRGDDAGWYLLHGDGIPAGAFGDWRTGFATDWRADIGRQLTPAEEVEQRERIAKAKREREAEEARRRKAAATKAAALWKAAAPAAEDHPYLQRKAVAPVETLRELPAERAAEIIGYAPQARGEALEGRLLVAPIKIGDALATAELIDESGRKSAVAGGAKAGGYWAAQALPEGDGAGLALLIGEGVATVLTAREASGHPAIAALSCGNLRAVGCAMRERYPKARLAVLADLGNGEGMAAEAARECGAVLVRPDFGDVRADGASDFNDMEAARGLEAVRACIADALDRSQGSANGGDGVEVPGDGGGAADDCDGPSVRLIRGDSITPEPVRWLWDGWLARGKFHVLAGRPGTGKTTLALALAATITNGGRWPDGSRAEAGDVLIWSGEDGAADTLVPRLAANGADRARVHFVGDVRHRGEPMPFDPALHMPALALAASRIGTVRLLIVDPVVSAVAGDGNSNTEVRRSLQPIVDLAARLDCAALGISHFSKGSDGRDVTERVTGSLAFGAAARIVLAAAKLKDGGEHQAGRIVARAKSNIGPDDGGFGYDLQQAELSEWPGVTASRVMWGGPIEGTARELLAQAEGPPEPHDGRAEAATWLRGRIDDAGGPMDRREIMADARAAGFSERTVDRARADAGITVRQTGFGASKRSVWTRAQPADDDGETSNPATNRANSAKRMCGGDGGNGGANGGEPGAEPAGEVF